MIDLVKLVTKSPVPTADPLAFFKALAEAYKENQITEREIARIEAAKEILITNIREKYSFYRETFNKVFAERLVIINKHFEIIDHGLKNNNRELVLNGLQGLSHVVATSPFADVANLSKMIENDIPIEI